MGGALTLIVSSSGGTLGGFVQLVVEGVLCLVNTDVFTGGVTGRVSVLLFQEPKAEFWRFLNFFCLA